MACSCLDRLNCPYFPAGCSTSKPGLTAHCRTIRRALTPYVLPLHAIYGFMDFFSGRTNCMHCSHLTSQAGRLALAKERHEAQRRRFREQLQRFQQGGPSAAPAPSAPRALHPAGATSLQKAASTGTQGRPAKVVVGKGQVQDAGADVTPHQVRAGLVLVLLLLFCPFLGPAVAAAQLPCLVILPVARSVLAVHWVQLLPETHALPQSVACYPCVQDVGAGPSAHSTARDAAGVVRAYDDAGALSPNTRKAARTKELKNFKLTPLLQHWKQVEASTQGSAPRGSGITGRAASVKVPGPHGSPANSMGSRGSGVSFGELLDLAATPVHEQ